MKKKLTKNRLRKYAVGGEVLDYSQSSEDISNLLGQYLDSQNNNTEEQEEIEMPESSIFGDDFLGFNEALSEEDNSDNPDNPEDYNRYWEGDKNSNSNSNSAPINYKIPNSGINANIKPLFDDYSKQYGVGNSGIWGDKKHQARESDHNTGDAIDLQTKVPRREIADKLVSEAKSRGIKYIIHDGKIWSQDKASQGWRNYTGNDPHKGHIHVSFYRDNNSQNIKKKKYAGGGEVMGAVGSGISTLVPIVMGLIDELNTGYTTQPVMSARQTASLNPYSKDFGSNSLPKFANGGVVRLRKDGKAIIKETVPIDILSEEERNLIVDGVLDTTIPIKNTPKNVKRNLGVYVGNPNNEPKNYDFLSDIGKPESLTDVAYRDYYGATFKTMNKRKNKHNKVSDRRVFAMGGEVEDPQGEYNRETYNKVLKQRQIYQDMLDGKTDIPWYQSKRDIKQLRDIQQYYLDNAFKEFKESENISVPTSPPSYDIKKGNKNINTFFPVDEYALGGVVSSIPGVSIEAEGEEVIQTPDGQMGEIQGPSHEQGGVDMNVPEGSMIYSDRIQIDGKSMADRKKAREKALNRIQKLVEKNPKDKLLQSSLQRTQEVLAMEEAKDTQIQQAAGQIMQGGRKKFATGGPVEDNWQGVPYPYESKPFDLYGNMFAQANPITEMPYLDTGNKPGVGLLPTAPPKADTLDVKSMGTQENKEDKISSAVGLTAGDYVGMAGNLMGAFSPLLNTLENRAGDKPNENFFKNFGKDALAANERAKTYIAGQRENALQDLRMQYNAAKAANRDRATGVNTIRAMDMATDLGAAKGKNSIYDAFSQQMMGLLGQQSQLENQQDSAVMQGEYQRDLADRQDRDNFYSQHGQDLANMGVNIQGFGKNLNTNQSNKDINSLISQLSQYGLGFVRDEKGNMVLSKI